MTTTTTTTTTAAPAAEPVHRAGAAPSRARSLVGGLGQAVSWVVVVVVLAVVVLAVVAPRLAGATPYTVLTGSMSPSYPPGTLVVVRPTSAAEIGTGDVITYQLQSGEPEVVTHRVVAVGYTSEGAKRFTTQGDANAAPDPDLVRPVQVRGELWYAVPWIGRLGVLFTQAQHQLMVYAAAGGMFAWALLLARRARRERRDHRQGAHV